MAIPMDGIPMDADVNESYVSPRRLPAWQSTVLYDPRHPAYIREDLTDDAPEEGMDTCPEGKILQYIKREKKGSNVATDCRRCFSRDLVDQRDGYAYCIDCGYAVCYKCLRNCTPPGMMCLPPPPPPALPEEQQPHGLEYPRLPERKQGAIRTSSLLATETLQFSRYPTQVFAPPIENGLLLPQTTDSVPPCADAAVKMLGLESKPKPGLLAAIEPQAVLGGSPGNPGGPLGRKWVLRGDDVVNRGADSEIIAEGSLVCLFHEGVLHIAKVLRNAGDDVAHRPGPHEAQRQDPLQPADHPSVAAVRQYKSILDRASDYSKKGDPGDADGPRDDYLIEIVTNERGAQRRARLFNAPVETTLVVPSTQLRRVSSHEADTILRQQHTLETELIEVTAKCLSLIEACTHLSKPYITRKKGNPTRRYSCEYVQCNWCGKVLVVNSQDLGDDGDAGRATYERIVFDSVGDSMLERHDKYIEFRTAATPPLVCGVKRSDGKGWTRKVVLLLPELCQLHRRGYIHTADFRRLTALRAKAPRMLELEKLWVVLPDGSLEGFQLPRGDTQVLVGPSHLVNGSAPITNHSRTITYLKTIKVRDEERKQRKEMQREILYQRAI